jgi:hypothetical protein
MATLGFNWDESTKKAGYECLSEVEDNVFDNKAFGGNGDHGDESILHQCGGDDERHLTHDASCIMPLLVNCIVDCRTIDNRQDVGWKMPPTTLLVVIRRWG